VNHLTESQKKPGKRDIGLFDLHLLLGALLFEVSWVFTGCHWISSDIYKERNTFLKIIITLS